MSAGPITIASPRTVTRPVADLPIDVAESRAAPGISLASFESEVALRVAERAARSTNAVGPVLSERPAAGVLTGWFGERRRGHSHPGVDIDGESGDPVRAAGDGTVVSAGRAPSGYGGYGTTVIIDHGGAIETVYAHLSRVYPRAGQFVRAGELVGAIGTTGNVTGSHLHFEVRVNGVPVDPKLWLAR